jgi:hypothetical protein
MSPKILMSSSVCILAALTSSSVVEATPMLWQITSRDEKYKGLKSYMLGTQHTIPYDLIAPEVKDIAKKADVFIGELGYREFSYVGEATKMVDMKKTDRLTVTDCGTDGCADDVEGLLWKHGLVSAKHEQWYKDLKKELLKKYGEKQGGKIYRDRVESRYEDNFPGVTFGRVSPEAFMEGIGYSVACHGVFPDDNVDHSLARIVAKRGAKYKYPKGKQYGVEDDFVRGLAGRKAQGTALVPESVPTGGRPQQVDQQTMAFLAQKPSSSPFAFMPRRVTPSPAEKLARQESVAKSAHLLQLSWTRRNLAPKSWTQSQGKAPTERLRNALAHLLGEHVGLKELFAFGAAQLQDKWDNNYDGTVSGTQWDTYTNQLVAAAKRLSVNPERLRKQLGQIWRRERLLHVTQAEATDKAYVEHKCHLNECDDASYANDKELQFRNDAWMERLPGLLDNEIFGKGKTGLLYFGWFHFGSESHGLVSRLAKAGYDVAWSYVDEHGALKFDEGSVGLEYEAALNRAEYINSRMENVVEEKKGDGISERMQKLFEARKNRQASLARFESAVGQFPIGASMQNIPNKSLSSSENPTELLENSIRESSYSWSEKLFFRIETVSGRDHSASGVRLVEVKDGGSDVSRETKEADFWAHKIWNRILLGLMYGEDYVQISGMDNIIEKILSNLPGFQVRRFSGATESSEIIEIFYPGQPEQESDDEDDERWTAAKAEYESSFEKSLGHVKQFENLWEELKTLTKLKREVKESREVEELARDSLRVKVRSFKPLQHAERAEEDRSKGLPAEVQSLDEVITKAEQALVVDPWEEANAILPADRE